MKEGSVWLEEEFRTAVIVALDDDLDEEWEDEEWDDDDDDDEDDEDEDDDDDDDWEEWEEEDDDIEAPGRKKPSTWD